MSILPATSQAASSSQLKRLIKHHPLLTYFVIAFAGTWLVDLPMLLGKDGLGLFPYRFGDAGMLVVWFSAFTGPFLASLLVTAITSGKAGIRPLLHRFVQWRVGVQWYFAALFGFLLIWLVGYSILLNGEPLVD